jgi:hypothetical protein
MNKIKSDFGGGKCYQITSYEYNNRVWPLNTQITITANGVECKKQNPTPGPGPKPNPGPGPKPNPVPPVPKKRCKYKPMIPGDFNHKNEEGVRQFQKFCATRTDYWYAEYTDGTKRNCSKQDVDGKWGCCSQNCYENLKKRRYSN